MSIEIKEGVDYRTRNGSRVTSLRRTRDGRGWNGFVQGETVYTFWNNEGCSGRGLYLDFVAPWDEVPAGRPDRVAELLEANNRMEQRARDAEAALAAARASAKEAVGHLDAAAEAESDEIADLRAQLDEVRGELAASRALFGRVELKEAGAATLAEALAAEQRRNEVLKKEVDQQREGVSRLANELDKETTGHNDAKAAVGRLVTDLEAARSLANSVMCERDELKKKVARLNAEWNVPEFLALAEFAEANGKPSGNSASRWAVHEIEWLRKELDKLTTERVAEIKELAEMRRDRAHYDLAEIKKLLAFAMGRDPSGVSMPVAAWALNEIMRLDSKIEELKTRLSDVKHKASVAADTLAATIANIPN